MSRPNEVGSDVGVVFRIPASLVVSVRALIKLHRGKVGCPQLYAAVAMSSIYDVFTSKTGAPPLWEPYIRDIGSYLRRLSMSLMEISVDDKVRLGHSAYEECLDFIDELIGVVEDTYSDATLFRELCRSLKKIESIEKFLSSCSS